jgi:hypothetical protein
LVGEEAIVSGEFDVLVVETLEPTVEFLSAVSLGIPVVGRTWITACARAKKIIGLLQLERLIRLLPLVFRS